MGKEIEMEVVSEKTKKVEKKSTLDLARAKYPELIKYCKENGIEVGVLTPTKLREKLTK